MKTYKFFTNLRLISSFVGLILLLSGCKKDGVDWYRPVGNPLNSNVKFINTLPGSRMDFYAYTAKIASNIPYGDTTIPYVKAPYGNIIVYGTNFNQTSFRVTGATSSASPQMGAQGLVADYFQTMFTCKTTDSTSAETIILLRDNMAAPAAGKAHIRFIHLAQRGALPHKNVKLVSTSGPQMGDIFTNIAYRRPSNSVEMLAALSQPTPPIPAAELAAKNSVRGLGTTGVGIYTSGPFTPVDAGTYNFDVQDTPTSTTIVTKTVNLESGKIYTIYTVGVMGTTIQLKVLPHSK